jgi:hypothetical protein
VLAPSGLQRRSRLQSWFETIPGGMYSFVVSSTRILSPRADRGGAVNTGVNRGVNGELGWVFTSSIHTCVNSAVYDLYELRVKLLRKPTRVSTAPDCNL